MLLCIVLFVPLLLLRCSFFFLYIHFIWYYHLVCAIILFIRCKCVHINRKSQTPITFIHSFRHINIYLFWKRLDEGNSLSWNCWHSNANSSIRVVVAFFFLSPSLFHSLFTLKCLYYTYFKYLNIKKNREFEEENRITTNKDIYIYLSPSKVITRKPYNSNNNKIATTSNKKNTSYGNNKQQIIAVMVIALCMCCMIKRIENRPDMRT